MALLCLACGLVRVGTPHNRLPHCSQTCAGRRHGAFSVTFGRSKVPPGGTPGQKRQQRGRVGAWLERERQGESDRQTDRQTESDTLDGRGVSDHRDSLSLSLIFSPACPPHFQRWPSHRFCNEVPTRRIRENRLALSPLRLWLETNHSSILIINQPHQIVLPPPCPMPCS